jgi:hypothetical protein
MFGYGHTKTAAQIQAAIKNLELARERRLHGLSTKSAGKARGFERQGRFKDAGVQKRRSAKLWAARQSSMKARQGRADAANPRSSSGGASLSSYRDKIYQARTRQLRGGK